MHEMGLWKEVGVSGEILPMHEDNMQTNHSRAPVQPVCDNTAV